MLLTSCLRLPDPILKKLIDSGCHYVEELFTFDKELTPEVKEIIKYPELTNELKECMKQPEKYSSKDVLEKEENCPRILTFCFRLDRILGGGVPLGCILELCGPPGSGKTQLCLQLCVSVQLHTSLGGLQGQAIYISTDDGFSPERISEIGRGCKEHFCKVARANMFNDYLIKTLENQELNKYFYISVYNYTQLLAIVLTLEDFIQHHNEVRLIIIDSLAFLFIEMNDLLKRTSIICKMLHILWRISTRHSVSVVITNHLTTRISQVEETQLIPALGESVGNLMNHRIMLGSLPAVNHFAGVVFKSPILPNESAKFQVTRDGVRDIQRI